MHVMILKISEDLIFMDGKLPMKTAKITSLENLYAYGMCLVKGAN